MSPEFRALLHWMLGGAGTGAMAFMAAAIYVIYMEVFYRCDSERCHSLGYAVGAILGHVPTLGALALLGGCLAGLAVGTGDVSAAEG
jgi:hypothetical protein